MHAVQCPNCRKMLRLDRPVEKARMRCRHCGQVFVGSSRELAARPSAERPAKGSRRLTAQPAPEEPPAPPPASPQTVFTPPPYPATPVGAPPSAGAPGMQPPPQGVYQPPMEPPLQPIRHKKSIIPLVVVCITVPAIIAVIVGIVLIAGKTDVTVVDSRGNVLERKRVDRGELARMQGDQGDGGGADSRGEETAGGPSGSTGEDSEVRPPPEPAPPSPRTPSGTEGDVADPSDMIEGDPKLWAAGGQAETRGDEDPNSGWFVGTVENRYDHPIQMTEIAVYTYDVNDKRRRPATGFCYYIPPGGKVRFCVEYRGLPKEKIFKTVVRAHSPTKARPAIVAWQVPMTESERSDQGRDVVITGKIKNPYSFAVKNIKVCYDMYTGRNIRINQATKLAATAPQALGPGEQGEFKITFSPGATGYMPRMVRSWDIRVWAEKS